MKYVYTIHFMYVNFKLLEQIFLLIELGVRNNEAGTNPDAYMPHFFIEQWLVNLLTLHSVHNCGPYNTMLICTYG